MRIDSAKLGDLITLRDNAGRVVASIEIDSTRKRSVALVVTAASCSIEYLPLDERIFEQNMTPGQDLRPIIESEVVA